MMYFVLTYDRVADWVGVTPFDDDASAFAELERATLAKGRTDEVVLFYVDSLDSLKRTHSRYFFNEREMIDATLATLPA